MYYHEYQWSNEYFDKPPYNLWYLSAGGQWVGYRNYCNQFIPVLLVDPTLPLKQRETLAFMLNAEQVGLVDDLLAVHRKWKAGLGLR